MLGGLLGLANSDTEDAAVLGKLVGAAAGLGLAAELAHLAVPWKLRGIYEQVGKTVGVDPNKLHALSLEENWQQDPNAIGPLNTNGTRDYGLMQINERNWGWLGLSSTTWRDPLKNVTAAATLLRRTKDQVPELTLRDEFAVYNAGLSRYGPAAKLDASGHYINARYVGSAFWWYVLIVAARFAPFQALKKST